MINRRSFFKRVTGAFAGLALCQQIVLAKFDTFKLEAPKITEVHDIILPSQEAMFESWMMAKKLREQRGMLEAHAAAHPWDHEAEKRRDAELEDRRKSINQAEEAEKVRLSAMRKWNEAYGNAETVDPYQVLRHVLKNSGKPA